MFDFRTQLLFEIEVAVEGRKKSVNLKMGCLESFVVVYHLSLSVKPIQILINLS